jgi:hypothetical protein
MAQNLDNLKPASPEDVVESLAFALQFSGRKRVHNADDIMARIVAKRLFEQLALSGFVIMTGPPLAPILRLAAPYDGHCARAMHDRRRDGGAAHDGSPGALMMHADDAKRGRILARLCGRGRVKGTSRRRPR